MQVLVEPAAWLRGLAGGMMIGLAASALILLSGRIAGISGVLGGLALDHKAGDRLWRVLFLAGLIGGGALTAALRGGAGVPAHALTVPLALAAGLLVGFGTRLGNGCTSGHGICGLARLSPRSFAATATFMAFGFLSVLVVRHLLERA